MPKDYVLLKFSGNWADEMDIEGFLVASRAYWEHRRQELSQVEGDLHACIGTNEYLEWSDGKELLDSIEVSDLSAEEVRLLQQHFPLAGYRGTSTFASVVREHLVAGFGETGFLDNVAEGGAY